MNKHGAINNNVEIIDDLCLERWDEFLMLVGDYKVVMNYGLFGAAISLLLRTHASETAKYDLFGAAMRAATSNF